MRKIFFSFLSVHQPKHSYWGRETVNNLPILLPHKGALLIALLNRFYEVFTAIYSKWIVSRDRYTFKGFFKITNRIFLESPEWWFAEKTKYRVSHNNSAAFRKATYDLPKKILKSRIVSCGKLSNEYWRGSWKYLITFSIFIRKIRRSFMLNFLHVKEENFLEHHRFCSKCWKKIYRY